MGIDPGILFPFGDHVDSNGNLKAGGKGILRYLYPFGDNVDENGNVKPRGANTSPRTDTSPRIERKPGPFDEGYVKPNTTMEPTEKATLSEYLNPGPTQETRRNGNGVVQSGMKMSGGVSAAFVPEYANSSFNDLLAAQGNQRYQPFSSEQLPTTASNPFSAQPPKTQSFNTEAESFTGNSLEDISAGGGADAASSTDRSQFVEMTGKEERIKGGSDRKAGGSLDEALADKAGINSYMKKFSGGSRERAARSAFLNAEDSLSGLQARDAVNDVVYAGGQHYGRDGDGTFEIDRADARGIASGKNTAAGLLESYKSRITEASKESTPAEQQEPIVLQDGAKNQAFKQDTPIASQMPSDIGGKTEYYSNNDNVDTSFGQPKGFKSGFKRIDTSMGNPFG